MFNIVGAKCLILSSVAITVTMLILIVPVIFFTLIQSQALALPTGASIFDLVNEELLVEYDSHVEAFAVVVRDKTKNRETIRNIGVVAGGPCLFEKNYLFDTATGRLDESIEQIALKTAVVALNDILNFIHNTKMFEHRKLDVGIILEEYAGKLYLISVFLPRGSAILVLGEPATRMPYAQVWQNLHTEKWEKVAYDDTEAVNIAASEIALIPATYPLTKGTYKGTEYFHGRMILGKIESNNEFLNDIDEKIRKCLQDIQMTISQLHVFSKIGNGSYVFGMISSVDYNWPSQINADSDFAICYVFLYSK